MMAAPIADSPCNCNDEEGYENAVSALLSPLHQSSTPEKIRIAAARRRNTLRDMHDYLHRLGLNNLNNDTNSNNNNTNVNVPSLIIHVTGTKGKGSTLSLCESILRNAYKLNTGMFTSPHLVSIRERIRINGVPVSRKVFGQVYWRVRNKLETFNKDGDGDGDGDGVTAFSEGSNGLPPLPVLPGYFRMLTLMALYTFCHYEHPKKIDVLLLEVGMGGRYDSTNLFEPTSPSLNRALIIRGVTLIDYDHTRVLGSTLEQIAWEKGGIFVCDKLQKIGMDDGGYGKFQLENDTAAAAKDQQQNQLESRETEKSGMESSSSSSSVVFVNGNNTPSVLSVLQNIANNNGCRVEKVQDSYMESSFPDIGLQGDHQRSNAALALSMCRYAMKRYEGQHSALPSQEELRGALALTFWPGRCHTVSLPSVTSDDTANHMTQLATNLRCDGAHTPISMTACIEWFRKVSASSACFDETRRVLVFNCSHERNPIHLLSSLYRSNLFDCVYFCKADFERPSAVPKRLEDGWTKEPINVENDCGGVDVTLESMCNAVAALNIPNDDESHVVPLDPAKLSDSTWQETLGNVWQVFDKYQRDCVDNHLPAKPSIKVHVGLSVKDALTSIRGEYLNNDDSDSTGAREKQVLIETCVTGSLYIVGSALQASGWEEGEASGCIG